MMGIIRCSSSEPSSSCASPDTDVIGAVDDAGCACDFIDVADKSIGVAEPEICGVSSPLRSLRWFVAVDAVSIDLVRAATGRGCHDL